MAPKNKLSITKKLALMLPLTIGLFLLDQWSKVWATTHLAGQPPRTYGLIFTTVYAENLGAWGSLGAGWSDSARFMILSLLPALVLGVLALYALFTPDFATWEVIGCSLVIGGGVGNLVDRFRLGFVQDFLYIGYGPIGTNIFNIADAVVMLGLGILVVKGILNHRQEKKPKA